MQIRSFLRRSGVLIPVSLLACSIPALAQNQIFDPRTLAPYVPTPENVVERMLELAKVSKSDVVFDLGSGDGRILFTAAEKFEAKAVGVEINPTLVEQTREEVEKRGMTERVSVMQEDILTADLSSADVVTVYLLSSSNDRLKPKLEAELKPGSRVVSHDFQFRGWRASQTVDVGDAPRTHRLYLYVMGEHADKQE